jgi:hypothetical protein
MPAHGVEQVATNTWWLAHERVCDEQCMGGCEEDGAWAGARRRGATGSTVAGMYGWRSGLTLSYDTMLESGNLGLPG